MTHKDPEKKRAAERAYHAAHREERNAYQRAYRAAHPEQCRTYGRTYRIFRRDERNAHYRAWRSAHPEQGQLENARRRAKRAGVACTLTAADVRALRSPMVCSVTGLTLVRGKGIGGCGPLSPTLDRIVPAMGYVPGNVRLVCHRFNIRRKDADVSRDAEFRARVLAELSG